MIKERNMWMQVLLYIFTLGIYWYYSTLKEMFGHNREDGSPLLWTVLGFVPIANLFAMWKHSRHVELITTRRYDAWLVFVLWIVFSPAMWFITQTELNKLARRGAASPQTAAV